MSWSRIRLLVCLLLLGCGGAAPVAPVWSPPPPRPPPPVPAQPCEVLARGADAGALETLYAEQLVPLPVAGDLVLSCPCGRRSLAGDTEQRTLAGDTEQRTLAGDTEQRSLAGDTEQRSLGGDTETLTCRPDPSCPGGYLLSGQGPLLVYSAAGLRPAADRCVR